ncbi:hypothetical protein SEA_BIG4_337 [Microbacterium phage Big4]|nr:hypothetical protein SEA_BIG4_11 [Microbacterium phage Big4]URP22370.1 hypothetical protein SEA_BIG4_337 [Microbacterium phage Big4]
MIGPVVAVDTLKPSVMTDLSLAEEDVPLHNGTHLTPAGVRYIQDRIDDPHDHLTEQTMRRRSYRIGLTSDNFEEYDRIMSIRSTKSRAAELRAEADRLAAERELVLARIAEAEAAASKYDEPEPGSKILIEAVFPGSERQRIAGEKTKYQYLALRTESPRSAGDNWYVTGQKGKTNWAAILRLVENAREVEIYDLTFRR